MRRQPKRVPVRPMPHQGDRKLESLRHALDAEDRARKTVKHQDRDGQRIEGVTLPPAADTTVRHRLGRKPRGVEIVGMPQGGARISVQSSLSTAEYIVIANSEPGTVTVTLWIY